MLKITIPKGEIWNEITQEFLSTQGQTICLEHSLVSISKWEAKWRKPFLSKDEKTVEETIDYIRCMTLTQNVDPMIYQFVTNDIITLVMNYIEAPMTATWFSKTTPERSAKKTVTSELIYYWMTALNIPIECQKWHLNRLLTLIRVCNEENKPRNKLSRSEARNRTAALNAARRKRSKPKR